MRAMALSVSVRVLVCASEADAQTVSVALGAGSGRIDVTVARSGCDAMEHAYGASFDAVVIHGAIDGCDGLRVAGALSAKHHGPVALLVDPKNLGDARRGALARGLTLTQVLRWPDGPQALHRWSKTLQSADDVEPDTSVESAPYVSTDEVDVVVLLGSAGTPHMLPGLLPKLSNTRVPVVVAVHHNPRLSRSFLEWVSEIADTAAFPLTGGGPLPALTVVTASACEEELQPNLQSVMEHVLMRARCPMVVVTSGMQFEGTAGVREAAARGGPLLGLRPESCPQPAMVRELCNAGLDPTLCSQAEISRLILQATRTAGESSALAANRASTWWTAC